MEKPKHKNLRRELKLKAIVESQNKNSKKPRKGAQGKTSGMFLVYKELNPDATSFPLGAMGEMLKYGSDMTRVYTLRLGADSAVTTDGSGLLQTVYSNIPSGAQNWANIASVFSDVRVLAFTVKFRPTLQAGGATATYWCDIETVVDRNDATALTGYGLGTRAESSKESAGGRPWKATVSMNGVEDSAFVPTSAPVATNWIKIYSSGNSAGLTVGRVQLVWIVQFRALDIN